MSLVKNVTTGAMKVGLLSTSYMYSYLPVQNNVIVSGSLELLLRHRKHVQEPRSAVLQSPVDGNYNALLCCDFSCSNLQYLTRSSRRMPS